MNSSPPIFRCGHAVKLWTSLDRAVSVLQYPCRDVLLVLDSQFQRLFCIASFPLVTFANTVCSVVLFLTHIAGRRLGLYLAQAIPRRTHRGAQRALAQVGRIPVCGRRRETTIVRAWRCRETSNISLVDSISSACLSLLSAILSVFCIAHRNAAKYTRIESSLMFDFPPLCRISRSAARPAPSLSPATARSRSRSPPATTSL